MKSKLSLLLLAFVMLFALPITITSCGGDDTEDVNPAPSDSIPTPGPGPGPVTEVMSPVEQKEFMEKVALNFIDEFKTVNFESLVDLTTYLSEEYSDYDTDEIDEWLEDYLDAITKYIGTSSKKDYWAYEHYDNYERLYMLSNLKGKFTANNYEWVYEKSNNLQFIVKDMYGQRCVANLTTSGNAKKVYVGRSEDWSDFIYDGYDYHEYYNVYENTIAVPERMELTFTQGSKTVVKVVVNTDLSSMRGEEFDLSKDSYSVSAKVAIENYEINAEKVAYRAGKDASVSYKMKHNGKNLISITVSADVDVTGEEINYCKNANVSIDIMGNIQIKGKCNDVMRYCEYLEEADDSDDNEHEFKSYINMANSLLDLGVYYNGKDYKYAQMRMEPAVDKSYYYEEWYCDYVIYFNEDNTTYTLLEVFFNDRNFRTVINKLENLIESFSDMLN